MKKYPSTLKSKTKLYKALSLGMALVLSATSAHAANISKEQIIADISYLASDQLKGRASFSPEIDQAADYISKRFKEIGLTPLKGQSSFKQHFTITNIAPVSLSVTLNDKNIDPENLAMASTMEKISWHKGAPVDTHVIGAQDDMRGKIRALNQQGGQHLVLLNSAHQDMFKRYQHYFQQGLNKLNLEHQGAIVMVLTDMDTIDSFKVEAISQIEQRGLTNVVGTLPGKDKTDEMVLFSSHYDHLGTSKYGEDTIYNGADDDASGTAAVINLAQYYASKGQNSRTLVFSAFTAEEIGGFGSRYFSKQLDPEQVVAMINIEMIGKPSKFGQGTLWMTGKERSDLGDILNKNLKVHGKQIYTDPYPEQGLFYRSDNATLARLGVPAHSFSSTQLDKDQHYHQVSDDLDSLNLDSMHQVIETLSIGTSSLVDGSMTPSRIDINKVEGHGKIY